MPYGKDQEVDRREFLKASPMAAVTLATQTAASPGRAEEQAIDRPFGVRDYWNDLPNRMASKIAKSRQLRKSDLAKLTSAAGADNRTSLVREKVWKCIGGKLDETPLNPTVT